MANQCANAACHNTPPNRHWQVDQERLESADQLADLIRHKNHFNFIKMHYLSHFAFHEQHFVGISMYTTKIGELAHKQRIKDAYRRSNKNNAGGERWSQYGRQHSVGMRLHTIEELLKTGMIVIGNGAMEMLTCSSRSAPRPMLKSHVNIGTRSELC